MELLKIFQQIECLIFGSFHDFTFSRTFIVYATQMQNTVNNDAVQLCFVSCPKLLCVGTDCIKTNK